MDQRLVIFTALLPSDPLHRGAGTPCRVELAGPAAAERDQSTGDLLEAVLDPCQGVTFG